MLTFTACLAIVVGIEEEVGEPQSAAVWGGGIQLKSELGERGWGGERGCNGSGDGSWVASGGIRLGSRGGRCGRAGGRWKLGVGGCMRPR